MTVASNRPRCFFDIEIAKEPKGRIIFELFSDVCPITSENFRSLCTGERGLGRLTNKPLHYKNCTFHRVIKDFVIQSGDFESGNGTGGESIYGGQFNDENFILSHDKPFLLSMANKGKNTNGSQFFITTKETPHLNGKHTVFGRVILGHDVISEIENIQTDQNSKPVDEVRIADCGELEIRIARKNKKRVSSLHSEDASSDDSHKKHKKKKHVKKHKKEKRKIKEHSPEKSREEQLSCSVDPAEIPSVPVNNFLMRRTSDNDFDRSNRIRQPFEYQRRPPPAQSKSGRKIKGRGFRRYRTPSPNDDRSGSETPPHWKKAQSRLKPLKEVFQQSTLDSEEEMSAEEENSKSSVLRSRLGLVSRNNNDDEKRNLYENYRDREFNSDAAHNRSYRTNGRKSDLFKELIDKDKMQDYFNPPSPRQESPVLHGRIHSSIVVKSSVVTKERPDFGREKLNFYDRVDNRYNKRPSRHYTDDRPHSSRFKSAEDQDVWSHKKTRNEKKDSEKKDNDKNKSKVNSAKPKQKFASLSNSDILKYFGNDIEIDDEKENFITKSDKKDESTGLTKASATHENMPAAIGESSDSVTKISSNIIIQNDVSNEPLNNNEEDNINFSIKETEESQHEIIHSPNEKPYLDNKVKEDSIINITSPAQIDETSKTEQIAFDDTANDNTQRFENLVSAEVSFSSVSNISLPDICLPKESICIVPYAYESNAGDNLHTSEEPDSSSGFLNEPPPPGEERIPSPQAARPIESPSLDQISSPPEPPIKRRSSSSDERTRRKRSSSRDERSRSRSPRKKIAVSPKRSYHYKRGRSHSSSPHSKSPSVRSRRDKGRIPRKSRSRSRSARRSTSRSRYSRSSDARYRRPAYQRDTSRRSPVRREPYRRRYGGKAISPAFGRRGRGRSHSRRTTSRSRSRSRSAKRRYRSNSNSSSSSSSSSGSERSKNRGGTKNIRGRKRRSPTSSRSKSTSP